MTKYIGAHVSASGGVGNAILNAEATVAAIREATALLLEDGKLKLVGKPNKMKVFKTKMENTKEYGLCSNIDFLLKA